jgi:hypothetical protein
MSTQKHTKQGDERTQVIRMCLSKKGVCPSDTHHACATSRHLETKRPTDD